MATPRDPAPNPPDPATMERWEQTAVLTARVVAAYRRGLVEQGVPEGERVKLCAAFADSWTRRVIRRRG